MTNIAFIGTGKNDLALAMERAMQADKMQDSFMKSAGFSDFSAKLKSTVDEVVSKYRDGVDLNAEIAKIAKDLNDDQLNRVIHGVNNTIYQQQFSKTAGKEDRTVSFAIADPKKIRANMGRVDAPADNSSYVESEGEEKVASYRSQSMADIILGITDEPVYSDFLPAASEGFYDEYLREKIAKNLQEDLNTFEKYAGFLSKDTSELATEFFKFASAGIDHQKIFGRMCKRAGMRKTAQLAVIKRFDQIRELNKEASAPDLAFVDIDTFKDFSLGRHSLSKVANEEILSLPEAVDTKRRENEFERLVQIAMKIQSDDAFIDELNGKIEAKKQLLVTPAEKEEIALKEEQLNE